MSRRKTRGPQELQKSVLSKESQLLLEEIFAFFDNREAAKKDPDLCLEAMLTEIREDLADHPITAMLQGTLDSACVPTAPEITLEAKKRGEYRGFKTEKARTG